MSIEQNKINEMSFEESLKELEKIVERLSTGETSLDELLSLYEAGVAYLKHCQSRLGAAEAKIKILSEQLSPRLDTEGNNG
ncbi:MAG TPA: exodeoxyribonuclease VII small subunit [Candidatus Cloacimonas sp.]|nr:exodeoxyribonuclease VII small subunit [Candidatus Cloacimonas sp.]HOQ78556.1 exodeoxyribonuclease VII small subunit [Candidatus Cloacimonas sp.]HOU25365.1 exodeoxyribonuclease VII small subunit [Candidatus Cloacimonas sp.]HPK60638.1 exodeoxyribonuclease VII small subunit [Candidatus Cloacimonas sp.]HPV64546.1 exodeoxyribonuclease VII small subunit [Candidatus Cloacimonas sp.]